jgi:beta-mannosidase
MRKIISISDKEWQFKELNGKNFLPAEVPGNVLLDLFNNNLIPEPFFGKNPEKLQWVAEKDWIYKKDFTISKEKEERIFLHFKGVDYSSEIYLNEIFLGKHLGMFSDFYFEITDKLKENNELRVFLNSFKNYKKRSRTLRCQMSYGWDIAPRLLNQGIWDEVELIIIRKVFIKRVLIKSVIKNKSAEINISLEIDAKNIKDAQLETIISQKDSGEFLRENFKISLKDGENKFSFSLNIDNPKLWFPYDKGYPYLYKIDLILKEDEGILDNFSTDFGIREIKMLKTEEAKEEENWIFSINGEREYIRGANWTPPDSLFGRIDKKRYQELINRAKELNINMFRVWGGGLKEKEEFYKICDRLGILIWQEFPFACIFFDKIPQDKNYLDFINNEISSIVKNLYNHPSVVLYCGGNEFSLRQNKKVLDFIKDTVEKIDNTRQFHPVSPAKGDIHNWKVWHYFAPFVSYKKDNSSFASEFGLQSIPNLKSLKKFIPEEKLFPVKPLFSYLLYDLGLVFPFVLEKFPIPGKKSSSSYYYYHNAQLLKLFRYAKIFKKKFENIEELIEYSQKAQAFALKTAIEHYRRRKYKCGGCIFWQFAEPWPAISFGIIDYYSEVKFSYNIIKEIYNPLFISLDYELKKYKVKDVLSYKVFVINDYSKEFEDCILRIYLVDEKNIYLKYEKNIDIPKDCCFSSGEIKWEIPEFSKNIYLKVELLKDEKIISSNEYDLNWEDKFKEPLWGKIMFKIFLKLVE